MSNTFLQITILTGVVVSILSGIVGSYIVARKLIFMTGSISHAVLGGVGISLAINYYLSVESSPMLGAFISAIIFSYVICQTEYEKEQAIIATIWSFGMSLGVIAISTLPSNLRTTDFLFGNILWISKRDLLWTILITTVIAIMSLFLHKRFLAISFDEIQSYLQREPRNILFLLLLCMISITIVILMKVIGVILLITTLCLPPAIANLFTHSLSKIIFLSVILSNLLTFLGIYFSFVFDTPPGPTIAIVTSMSYFLALPIKRKLSIIS